MEEIKDYLTKVQGQLRDWDNQLEDLKKKADQAQSDAKEQYRLKIVEIKQKKEKLAEKFEQIKTVGENAGEELKKGLEEARLDLEKSVQGALAQFK